MPNIGSSKVVSECCIIDIKKRQEEYLKKWDIIYYCNCKDNVNEGKYVRKIKHCFRIIFATLLFFISSIMYGMITILIVRDSGFKFKPIDILISIPIGFLVLFTAFNLCKFICCRKEKNFNLFTIFCL